MFGGSGNAEEPDLGEKSAGLGRNIYAHVHTHENAGATEFLDEMPEVFGQREISVLAQRQKANTSCREK